MADQNRAINPWVVLVVLCLGFFMILLDTTIVNIAIPAISSGLSAGLDQILWVVNAYLLIYAVLLITAGRLGDLFGPKILFIIGLAIFTVASAVCGFAQDSNQLIAARVLQGFGGALLTPQTLAFITSIFPPQSRGAAFGIWGGIAGLGVIAGPVIGGLLINAFDWRWIFFVNIPFGVAAVVASILILPDLRPGRRHRLDLVGVALATGGLLGLTFGLIEGQRYDWGAILTSVGGTTLPIAITIPMIIIAGLVLLGFFVFWESRQAEPLVPLSIFSDRNFSVANGIMVLFAFGMLGLFLPLTIYLQAVLGLDALHAGLAILPMPLASMFIAPASGRLSDRYGGKWFLLAGLTLFPLGMGLLAWIAKPDSDVLSFIPPLVISGIGMGFIFAPITTVALRNIEPRMAGAASGIMNTSRQVGGVLGSAIMGAILQNQLANRLHTESRARASELPAGLPAPARDKIVGAFDAAHGALEVGRSQSAPQGLPAGVPRAISAQVQHYFHDVFINGYTGAMRPTLALPVVVVFLGAFSVFAIRRRASVDKARPAAEPVGVG